MAKNPYYLTTKGFNAEVVVAAPLAYTSQSTIALFVANAAEGEIGIYNVDTGSLLSTAGTIIPTPVVAPTLTGSTAGGTVAANTYYIVYSYTSSTGGESVKSAEASVTTTGAASSITVNIPAGPAGAIPKIYIGTTTATQTSYYLAAANATSYVITTTAGTAGTPLSAATGTIPAPAAIGANIAILQKRDGLLNQTVPFKVAAGSVTKTAYSAPVQDVWTITTFPTWAAGQTYSINIVDTTGAAQPFPVFNYEYLTVAGDTNLAGSLANAVLLINSTTNPVNYAYGPIVTASTSGSNLVLTAVAGRSIRVILRSATDYFTSGVTLTHTTQFQVGVGTYDHVAEVEGEGIIFSGVTTNYPSPTNALPSEFGTASLFAQAAKTYNTFLITFYQDEKSPLPLERHFQKRFIVLFTPSSGTTPDVAVTSILGF